MLYGYRDIAGEWRRHTRISNSVYFNHPEKIAIGDDVYVGHYCILDGTGGLKIGDGCQIAGWSGIYTHSSHISIRAGEAGRRSAPEHMKPGFIIKPVKLGRSVFVGAGAMIFPGVIVGDRALIHAGAIVTRDVGEFEIVAGVPAKVIGDTRDLAKSRLGDVGGQAAAI